MPSSVSHADLAVRDQCIARLLRQGVGLPEIRERFGLSRRGLDVILAHIRAEAEPTTMTRDRAVISRPNDEG
ncbi:hypothetical protein RB623_29130 [Mesorhizobium sp. LHD-90]|uniref:hypothetical protein n=1 Tax=Mesorhizobium sp. LHD-90 TaxID=3071414 RepID=UPI0027E13414|nr:hypothetical protein [Mesorhizobium sp. LHD-90]MDQ6438136.1 hypothetical protein [Mesorhizobium sp. LHD-90]